MISKLIHYILKSCLIIRSFVIHVIQTLKYLFTPDRVLLNSWIDVGFFSISNRNFGDDINIPILKELSGKKLSILNSVWSKDVNYLCIGSVIDSFCNPNSIVWGSGVLDPRNTLECKPKRVCAVRGVLTREYLLKYGIECPEIYGDPALLLPLIYKPNIGKKHKYGIIPHYCDIESPVIQRFLYDNPDVLLINVHKYKSWQLVIDQICSCSYILSSSLHGQIISDAFNIPNIQIVLSNKIRGGLFKYMDYYSGVNREWRDPVVCLDEINLLDVEIALHDYRQIKYDYSRLLNSFPLVLSDKYEKYVQNNYNYTNL